MTAKGFILRFEQDHPLVGITETPPDLQKLSSESQHMMCVANSEGYFVKMNPAFSRILGFSDQELRRQNIFDFGIPEDREKTIAEFRGLANGIQTVHFENRYRAKDG